LFVAVGVPAGWIIGPRFLLALIVVWSVRFLLKFTKPTKNQLITYT